MKHHARREKASGGTYFSQKIGTPRYRRLRQLHRRLLIFAITAGAASVLLCFFAFGVSGLASERKEAPEYKYYTSVRVEAGEDLAAVAARCYDSSADAHYSDLSAYIKELRSINHLRSVDARQDVVSGDFLIVPYYQ